MKTETGKQIQVNWSGHIYNLIEKKGRKPLLVCVLFKKKDKIKTALFSSLKFIKSDSSVTGDRRF